MVCWKPKTKFKTTKHPNSEKQSIDHTNGDPPLSENAESAVEDDPIIDDAMKDREGEAPADEDIESMVSKMSSLMFVPSSVRSGRGGRRGGAKQ